MKKIIQKFIYKLVKSSFRLRQRNIINDLILQKQLIIGNHTYGINNLDIHTYKGSESKIIIGKYCSLSKNITVITGGNHPLEWISTYPFRANWDMSGKYEDGMPYSNGDIIIGNDVWIGHGVKIMSGVNIGTGAVIASNSLVTKNVLPYTIVGGVPSKPIKKRFDDDTIKDLLDSKWWDIPYEKLEPLEDLMYSKNIKGFLSAVKQLKSI